MKLKTVTWNIGGGKLLEDGEDPTKMASYSVDGIESIAKWLEEISPDIMAIQEAHGNEDGNQIQYIAKYLGYDYYFYDPTSDSHVDDSQKLGNGLISKYPISNQKVGRFFNPNITFQLEDRVRQTHDKGYGSCDITIGNIAIHATTLHLIPFRSVGIEFDSETGKKIISSISSELQNESDTDFQLIQGDFNIDANTVSGHLAPLFSANKLSEIVLDGPTTPNERMYDHVLYNGLNLKKVDIDSGVKTDHYPVTCDFEF